MDESHDYLEGSAHGEPARKRRRPSEDEQDNKRIDGVLSSKPQDKTKFQGFPRKRGRPSKPKKLAVNPVKNRIRDLRRLLAGVADLPADVRIGAERELAESEEELRVTEAEIEKNNMISKYHMVRFFDRQKATRRLKRLHKELSDTSDPSQILALRQDVHIAEVDLNYTLYFPLDQPYPSLWPTKNDAEGKMRTDGEAAEAGIRAADQGMWKIVERCMQDGTLEALRDGAMTRQVTLNVGPPTPQAGQRIQRSTKALQKNGVDISTSNHAAAAPKRKRGRKRTDHDYSDGDGEGFFDDEDGGVRL